MKTDTSKRLVEYIKEKRQVSSKELAEHLQISRQALFKHISKLLEGGHISRAGKPPKVFYSINQKSVGTTSNNRDINHETKKIIEEHYLYITPAGEMKNGWEGFVAWCEKTGQDPVKTAGEYVATLKKYDSIKANSLIDGMEKFKTTFKDVYLDSVFYLDFYAIERFGKTRLGQLLLYAKQSQDKSLIRTLVNEIKPRIERIIHDHDIDGVLFIPPTVKREVQFMKELESLLNLPIRKIDVTKLRTEIIVPQKTLTKLEDRIENASHTIIVEDKKAYKNILLIDDAVGSGATLNETARQIKDKGLSRGKIIGLAITGSFKGFDVISEV